MTNGEVLLGLTTVGIGAAGLFYLSRQKPVSVSPPPQAPPTPTGLAASQVTPTSAVLSWNVSAGASAYTPLEDGSPLPSVSGTSVAVTGLVPETTYHFAMQASNAVGASAVSAAITVTTPPAPLQPPGPPSGLKASNITQTSVDLDWGAAASASAYTPYENGIALAAVTGTSATITGLTPGTTYLFAADAVNAAGHSAPSAAISVTTAAVPTAPGTPTGLAASNVTQATVDLDCDPDPTATSYVFFEGSTALPAVSTPSIQVTGLTPGKTYLFAVEGVNAVGHSPKSATISVTMGATATPPPVPTGLVASNLVPGGCTLNWNGSLGADTFTVSRPDGTVTPNIAATTLVVTGLDGGSHIFQVAACNVAGCSAKSASITVKISG